MGCNELGPEVFIWHFVKVVDEGVDILTNFRLIEFGDKISAFFLIVLLEPKFDVFILRALDDLETVFAHELVFFVFSINEVGALGKNIQGEFMQVKMPFERHELAVVFLQQAHPNESSTQ